MRIILRPAAAAVALALAFTGACGGDDEAAEPTTTTEAETTTTAAAPAVVTGGAPLTGVPADAAAMGRPALIVKLDNAPKGRPQAGINQADVVVEEMVEGGVTRLAAIFHSTLPGSVGPVRSFRTTDLAIATALNRPLLSYSGANSAFLEELRRAAVVDAGPGAVSAYRRERGRPAPYNYFADVSKLYSIADRAGGPPPPMFVYRADTTAVGGEPAVGVAMEYRGRIVTAVEWRWDAASGTYRRVQNGTEHVDAAGQPVAPRNVVVHFAEYRDTGHRDQSGEPVPEAELLGEGEAWVFTAGNLVKGRWSKPDLATPTRYTDAAGNPILLTPGQTWLELPRPGTARQL